MSNEIILGIIIGLLTSIISWATIKILNVSILPWYYAKTYKGISFAGKWLARTEIHEDVYQDELIIKQVGDKITGTYECKNIRKSEPYPITTRYTIQGIAQDGCAIINYLRKDNTGNGMGSFLLKYLRGGDRLEGSVVFIEIATGAVIEYSPLQFRQH